MSNYNLKAKHRKTGKIIEFTAFDNFNGRRKYGYKAIDSDYIFTEDKFDEHYEVVEDPNHPYGGMETWRDRFENSFFYQGEGHWGHYTSSYDEDENLISDRVKAWAVPKSFIDFFQQELERICEEVEKLKYNQPLLGTPESTERVMNAVNNTIDDIINIIKK